MKNNCGIGLLVLNNGQYNLQLQIKSKLLGLIGLPLCPYPNFVDH